MRYLTLHLTLKTPEGSISLEALLKNVIMVVISVITHQESDTLECEDKWALGSITMNKASGDDRIPAE